jgi:hypothetical protein
VKQQDRSWLALITFCAATAFIAALGLAILFTSATVAFAVARSFDPIHDAAADAASPQSYQGVISDAHCGGRHIMKDKSPAECTRLCRQKGSEYTLVDGDKAYTLDGNSAEIGPLAGERVTVSGTLQGSTIKVSSIKPLQLGP